MMFQLAVIDIGWIMGLAIMFGLALMMTYFTYQDTETFFIFLTIFCGFVVWGGLLDLWVLVLNLIILSVMMIVNMTKRGI